MRTISALKFTCHTNAELNGTWTADETKAECAELGMTLTDEDDWMRYLFMHLLGEHEEWTDELEQAFISSATIEAKYRLGDDIVVVTKRFS